MADPETSGTAAVEAVGGGIRIARWAGTIDAATCYDGTLAAGIHITLLLPGTRGAAAYEVEGAPAFRAAPGRWLALASGGPTAIAGAVAAGSRIAALTVEIDRATMDGLVGATTRSDTPADDRLRRFVAGKDGRRGGDGAEHRSLLAIGLEIAACRHTGVARQLFLQARALDLLRVAIEGAADGPGTAAALRPADAAALREVRRILETEFDDPPDLPTLARRAGLSVSKLSRAYKAAFGMTISDTVTECRLREALALIRDQNLDVAQAAYRVGYAPAHLSVAFKRRFGVTPSTLARRGRTGLGGLQGD